VTPLSLATLSKNPVLIDLFQEDSWANHVMLGRWADIMIIAPLSCNSLSKMAHGICDNLLLATWLSAKCPVVLAPAMDEDMWHHPVTKDNLEKLRGFGTHIIPVDKGELASGLWGDGRMAEPASILEYIKKNFFLKRDLEGKKVLITAGPTHEAIDPARFIGNHSSGKMGVAIAREMAARGARVHLVMGPTAVGVTDPGLEVQAVETAAEMYEACIKEFPGTDITVMAAAVADYTPVKVSTEKIKKNTNGFTLELTRTKDILQQLGESKTNGQLLVGFALENRNEKHYAEKKLTDKKADMIVLNSLNDEGAGFGYDTNKITIFERGGKTFTYDQKPKQAVAKDIVDRIVNMLYA
jgi:phosphopantothenoylcysteine decarboxylase / phosphopantothenate---cysteine ligase